MSSLPSKPKVRPRNPHFSSGPSAKRMGWSPSVHDGALIGRSHRSQLGKAKLAKVGATVENADMVRLWLDWAFEVTRLGWKLGEEARLGALA